MAYIGKTPVIGNFQVCDAISVVNGQAAYTMQVGGVNVSPESANHMLVSLNGILQAPTSSFTVSGSTITFASNLVTNDVIDFIQILGDVLSIGTPSDTTVTTAKLSDSSVSLAKLTATGTKDATTFLRGDNTFAAAGSPSIVDNGNATAITINSNEIVTFSSLPAFSAGISSATTFSQNTFYIFPDVGSDGHFNQGSHYSTSTGQFTAPVDGIYKFYCSMIWQNVSQSTQMADSWRFRKNTTSLNYDSRRSVYVANYTGTSGYYTTHQSMTIKLTANDTFGVYVGSSASEEVHGNTNFTYFEGYLIG